MKIAKWGNSLAIRIPADVVTALGLKEGDDIELRNVGEGEIAIITEQERRAQLDERLRALRGSFPADFKFDREEANRRK